MKKMFYKILTMIMISINVHAVEEIVPLLTCSNFQLEYRPERNQTLKVGNHNVVIPDFSLSGTRMGVFPNSEGIDYKSEDNYYIHYIIESLKSYRMSASSAEVAKSTIYRLVSDKKDTNNIDAIIAIISKTKETDSGQMTVSDTWNNPELWIKMGKSILQIKCKRP